MPEEKDKKLEYLKREEVKTMQKDIAELREVEAKQEREKISQIKTEEEIQREKEREERAQKAAMERKLAEEEASRRAEEIKRLREERAASAEATAAEEEKQEGRQKEGFKEMLKETQAREEEERKRFLERVEAKAECKEELPLSPPPPPPPLPPTTPEQLKPSAVLKKPSFLQKFWARAVLTLLILAIIAALAIFWYWYLIVKEKPAPPPVIETEQELIVPASLISTQASRVLEISSLGQILKEDLDENQFTRLIIKDPAENKVLGLKELFAAFEVKTPDTFYEKVDNNFTLFIYSSQDVNRLGFITKVKEPDLLSLLKYWENTMEKDFETFSIFLGKTGPSLISSFREAAYQNTVFHYLSFPRENFGICWAITDNYFILTFSGESMMKTIDKIGDEVATSSSISFLLK